MLCLLIYLNRLNLNSRTGVLQMSDRYMSHNLMRLSNFYFGLQSLKTLSRFRWKFSLRFLWAWCLTSTETSNVVSS
jgi:hypothetical protein